MRETIDQQRQLVPIPDEHPHAKELQMISDILDTSENIYSLAQSDLIEGGITPKTGRKGMTAEQVLRALIIYQMNSYSYEELAFHIVDSACYRAFCRIGLCDKGPSDKTLQRNIKKISASTLEALNKMVVEKGIELGIENGRTTRIDCTVEETNIHAPTDSSLLYDLVRVLARLMVQAREQGFDIDMVNHSKGAKRRYLEIHNAKNKNERYGLYRRLVKLSEATIDYAIEAVVALQDVPPSLGLDALMASIYFTMELEHYIALGRQVIDQTKRRVFYGEKVPSEEKVVSIFEPHTDIIKKDRRDVLYGHKLCLSQGKSGLFIDCMILEGNPPDTSLAVTAVERQKELFGKVPRQVCFDGGFTSRANLDALKSMGVKDVMFHKKRGLEIHEMVKSSWVYKQLKRFRAGIEGGISFLKRSFGLGRCKWKGFDSFKSYTWASIVTVNLLTLARSALST